MNSIILTLTISLIVLFDSVASDTPNTMGFLEGLPMEAVEQFVDVQLNRTITKADRDSRMNAWAKKQGKKVKKQFTDFMKKIKKDDREILKKRAKQVHNELTKQLNSIYNNPKLSYKDVCQEIGKLATKISNRVQGIAENGPKSHTPCSVDKKIYDK